jgi:hypothetical protein
VLLDAGPAPGLAELGAFAVVAESGELDPLGAFAVVAESGELDPAGSAEPAEPELDLAVDRLSVL